MKYGLFLVPFMSILAFVNVVDAMEDGTHEAGSNSVTYYRTFLDTCHTQGVHSLTSGQKIIAMMRSLPVSDLFTLYRTLRYQESGGPILVSLAARAVMATVPTAFGNITFADEIKKNCKEFLLADDVFHLYRHAPTIRYFNPRIHIVNSRKTSQAFFDASDGICYTYLSGNRKYKFSRLNISVSGEKSSQTTLLTGGYNLRLLAQSPNRNKYVLCKEEDHAQKSKLLLWDAELKQIEQVILMNDLLKTEQLVVCDDGTFWWPTDIKVNDKCRFVAIGKLDTKGIYDSLAISSNKLSGVSAMAGDALGTVVIVAAHSGPIIFFDGITGMKKAAIDHKKIQHLRFTDDDLLIVSGQRKVYIYDVITQKSLWSADHLAEVCATSADRSIMACLTKGAIYLWDMLANQQINTLAAEEACSLEMNKDGSLLCERSATGFRVWDIRNLKQESALYGTLTIESLLELSRQTVPHIKHMPVPFQQ
jgi:hypothetical protein